MRILQLDEIIHVNGGNGDLSGSTASGGGTGSSPSCSTSNGQTTCTCPAGTTKIQTITSNTTAISCADTSKANKAVGMSGMVGHL